MKLYISYYDNYVSIVEGIYNKKKNKYDIKNTMFLSGKDVELDTNDKYELLVEALRLNNFKSKNVVFSLNTRDVIIKTTQLAKVPPKDLDGIMNNDIYEMMSLDDMDYTFSYEVTNEKEVEGKETLDIIMAAILNEELEKIMTIFKDFKLNVERIDTIATSYGRLLKNIEYTDIAMINTGSYGSSATIYKEDALFIHDNIPVRINEDSIYSVSLALIDEVKGLMNFYSSRNYGKTVETMVLVGEHNNDTYVVNGFKETFNSEIIVGIENLFDIDKDITGNIKDLDINKVCDIFGSMVVENKLKEYSTMNLLPNNLRNKQKQKDVLKQVALAMPLIIGLMAAPHFVLGTMQMKVQYDTKVAQARLDEITAQQENIATIESDIKKVQDEIDVYDMLSSKSPRWGKVLTAIDKSIPYRAELTNINVSYDSSLVEVEEETTTEENQGETTETTEVVAEQVETPEYEKIPNLIVLEGVAQTPAKVGQFVYSLNKAGYFKSVDLKSSVQDKESEGYTFNIVLEVREDAVSS